MKTMKVEKDLKSKEAEVMQLKKQVNELAKENQCQQTRINELETACKPLENEQIHCDEMATRNIEHLQNILKDGKKTAADEYKKLSPKQDSLQERVQENDLKFKSLQHSMEELQKENATVLAKLNEVRKENEKLSKELHCYKKADQGNIETDMKIKECERDLDRKKSKLVYIVKVDLPTGY
ncbi:putative leucine-rich repeat-containing protein DDB_G0290503 [Ruditapes philippinarum]|uniref:putative leucine-rich repeat-containing protein DDB_G0290503 n=1 Tax=Ruditapes philippinarum TaxID=129788 RepID=UPI00295A6AAA|nr:putative leucine-rich repeat-containing protein DDB_G0290503 [Ruditapes philippinarum]